MWGYIGGIRKPKEVGYSWGKDLPATLQLLQLMKHERAPYGTYAHTTAASPAYRVDNGEEDNNRMTGNNPAPPTVQQPQWPGEGKDKYGHHHHHHQTPDHCCEQLFVGWKQRAGRLGMAGRSSRYEDDERDMDMVTMRRRRQWHWCTRTV